MALADDRMSAKTMTCAYCGAEYPWPTRKHWPTTTYAECWTCAVRNNERYRREPRWWQRLARRVRIDWRGFAVTRGGFFEWGRPSEYEVWPHGRPPERVPMLIASGGFCAPATAYYGESGWHQWLEWYCAHSWKLVDSFPPLSVTRGAVRYI